MSFGKYSRTDYFFSRPDIAGALVGQPGCPANLVPITYTDHAELPKLLRSLSPRERRQPFARIDDEFEHLRHPGASPVEITAPAWREFVDGEITMMEVDRIVEAQLEAQGWGFLCGASGTGKSTAAFRIAGARTTRGLDSYYLALNSIDEDDEGDVSRTVAAFRRLVRPGVLFIVDNVHTAPSLARRLWDHWTERSNGSHLLMLATKRQHTAGVAADDALTFFEAHAHPPAVSIAPNAKELGSIAGQVLRRFVASNAAVPEFAEDDLGLWHRTFGASIALFVAAVINRRADLLSGNFRLPIVAASDWVWDVHLSKMSIEQRTNLTELAILSSDIELDAPRDALAFPEELRSATRRGIVLVSERGALRYQSYRLRDAHFGSLVLSADSSIDRTAVLSRLCVRSPLLAMMVASRFVARNERERLDSLFISIGRDINSFSRKLEAMRPSYIIRFWLMALRCGDSDTRQFAEQRLSRIFDRDLPHLMPITATSLLVAAKAIKKFPNTSEVFWNAVRRAYPAIVRNAMASPHYHLWLLPAEAESQGHAEVGQLIWAEIEREADFFCEQLIEAPPWVMTSCLKGLEIHRRALMLEQVWAFFEVSSRLLERACEQPYVFTDCLVRTAGAQQRTILVERIWSAFSINAEQVVSRLFNGPLHQITTFVRYAINSSRPALIGKIWVWVEREGQSFHKRILRSRVDHIGAFIALARESGRHELASEIWSCLDKNHLIVAHQTWNSNGDIAVKFLRIVESEGHSDILRSIWSVVEGAPARLVETALREELPSILQLVGELKRTGRNSLLENMWQGIAQQQERVQDKLRTSSLTGIVTFMRLASRAGQPVMHKSLWEFMHLNNSFVARALWDTKLNAITAFCEMALEERRVDIVELVFNTLRMHPSLLKRHVDRAMLQNVTSFMILLKTPIPVLLGPAASLAHELWQVFANGGGRLREKVSVIALHHVAAFVRFAIEDDAAGFLSTLWKNLLGWKPFEERFVSAEVSTQNEFIRLLRRTGGEELVEKLKSI